MSSSLVMIITNIKRLSLEKNGFYFRYAKYMVSSNFETISPTQHRRAIGYTMFQSATISVIDSFTFAGNRRHVHIFIG